MFLGRVQGHVVATAKDPAIVGAKLLVIEPLKVDYADSAAAGAGDVLANASRDSGESCGFAPTGRAIVAMDMIGAGAGQLVLIVQGSSARMAQGCSKMPTDAVVVGIVDDAVVMGRSLTERSDAAHKKGNA